MGSKMVGFRVPEDIYEQIERLVSEHGQTNAEFLRKLVDDALFPPKAGLKDAGQDSEDEDEDESFKQFVSELNEIVADHGQDIENMEAKIPQVEERLNHLLQRLDNTIKAHNQFYASFKKFRICPDCGALLHMHLIGERAEPKSGDWHLECPECGYCTVDYKAPKWKEIRQELFKSGQGEIKKE